MGKLPSLGSCFTSRKLPQYVAAIIANIVAVAYGVVQGWPSPSLPLLRANGTTIGDEPVTVEQESWLGSLLFLGALFSSPVYSYINQNWGRKAAGYLSATPLIIGWLFIIFANSVTLLYIARFIQGVSLSGVNIFITMYMGEIAEDGIRGALGNFRGMSADIGIIVVYLIGPYLSLQNMGILSISMPVCFFLAFIWLPESPMFLLRKGKEEEARKAYLWFRGGDQKAADEEMMKLSAVMKSDKNNDKKISVKELLAVRGTRKALIIGLVLATVQQFSGMNVVFSYCATIFEMTGSSISPDMSAIIFSVVNLVGSIFSIFFSDIAGRRLILILTQMFQAVFLGGLGIYLYARHLGIDVSAVGVLPVIFVSLYCFCVVAGPANLFYVVVSETFRPEARGLAMSITSSTLWFLAFLSTKFYAAMVDGLGAHGCYWVFATVSFAGALFVYLQLPETKNRSLDSILRELNGEEPDGSKSKSCDLQPSLSASARTVKSDHLNVNTCNAELNI